MSRLPSLVALRAFDVAARHASMSRAAEDLNVTHGAISRHISALETEFGIPLFRRQGRSLELTAEGAQLAETLATAFRLIQAGVEQLQPSVLTLSCSATIMMRWLIPRLKAFRDAHPSVELRLHTGHGEIDFIRDEISIAIRNEIFAPPPEAITRGRIREWIGPVCLPGYAEEHRIRTAADLKRVRLLAPTTRVAAWADWAFCSGQPDLGLQTHELYEHFFMLIQAASFGLGVALAPYILVEDEIRSGRLVAPLGFVPSHRDLLLWIAPHLRARSDLRQLADWLEAEMRKSKTPPAQAKAG